jgi:hypothetical protein
MGLFFKEKHGVPLRPIDGAVFKKKHVVPLRPIDGAVVPKKHVFNFTCHRCDIYIYKLWINI